MEKRRRNGEKRKERKRIKEKNSLASYPREIPNSISLSFVARGREFGSQPGLCSSVKRLEIFASLPCSLVEQPHSVVSGTAISAPASITVSRLRQKGRDVYIFVVSSARLLVLTRLLLCFVRHPLLWMAVVSDASSDNTATGCGFESSVPNTDKCSKHCHLMGDMALRDEPPVKVVSAQGNRWTGLQYVSVFRCNLSSLFQAPDRGGRCFSGGLSFSFPVGSRSGLDVWYTSSGCLQVHLQSVFRGSHLLGHFSDIKTASEMVFARPK